MNDIEKLTMPENWPAPKIGTALCSHKEFIGRPIGYTAQYWECAECNIKLSAGEMMLLHKILALENVLRASHQRIEAMLRGR